MFHYIVENGVTYLCMADEQSRRRIPFAFLEVRHGMVYLPLAGGCVAHDKAETAASRETKRQQCSLR